MNLYAFPSFDKCDSLLFFPTTMAKCLNSGDYPALSKLMSQHLHKNCKFNATTEHLNGINSTQFLTLFMIMGDMHPDSITCVHSTKVVGNEVQASIFCKFTENETIFQSVSRRITDPMLVQKFKGQRSDRLEHKLQNSDEFKYKSDEERHALVAVVEKFENIEIFMRVEFVLSVDNTTNKVMSVKFLPTLTSVRGVPSIE